MPPKASKIWMNGKLVEFADAKVHVLSHVLHYGTAVFEGIRVYAVSGKPHVFRLRDHIRRLVESARIYRMEIPWSRDEIEKASVETVRANGFKACYIRPLVYRGFGEVGVNPLRCPVECAIAVWEWGAYLGAEALEKGVDVQVSSWTRVAPNTLPSFSKCAANYMNAQLIKMEAIANGFVEGLALDSEGFVSEGSGENVFLVRDGVLYTPPISSSILVGVTRATVMTLAAEAGVPVREERIPREMLYVADELFLTGTATEVTPVRSVDRLPVGAGKPGPVTREIQRRFLGTVTGEVPDKHGWLTPVP